MMVKNGTMCKNAAEKKQKNIWLVVPLFNIITNSSATFSRQEKKYTLSDSI